jgi:hypothetical protein
METIHPPDRLESAGKTPSRSGGTAKRLPGARLRAVVRRC